MKILLALKMMILLGEFSKEFQNFYTPFALIEHNPSSIGGGYGKKISTVGFKKFKGYIIILQRIFLIP